MLFLFSFPGQGSRFKPAEAPAEIVALVHEIQAHAQREDSHQAKDQGQQAAEGFQRQQMDHIVLGVVVGVHQIAHRPLRGQKPAGEPVQPPGGDGVKISL